MLTRTLLRTARLASKPTTTTTTIRPLSTTPSLLTKDGGQPVPNTEYAAQQTSKPINPKLDSHTSTNHPDRLPKAGDKNAPPEFLSSVAPEWAKRVGGAHLKPDKDHETVFELKIDPVNRDGEKVENMRARLLYQSRKRGILETDLLLSTFAEKNLPTLSEQQLKEYDKFLDEADWDIYYWCTQEAPPTSAEYAEGAAEDAATVVSAGRKPEQSNYGAEEWAQTVGKAKVPYKVIPDKWKNSEILGMLRQHVEDRKGEAGGGLGRMPSL